MKNISQITNLTNDELFIKIKALAEEERKITLEILRLLREVESRRLYAEHACESVHEFCTKKLKYSAGAAHRRIKSMQLLKEVPEAEEKIKSGETNISVLTQIQTYIVHEEKNNKSVSAEEKQKLVESFSGKSVREVQRDLIELAPTLAPKFKEEVIALPENKTALKIIVDEEFMKLYEQARSLGGTPDETMGEVIKRHLRFYVKRKTTYGRIPKDSQESAQKITQKKNKPEGAYSSVTQSSLCAEAQADVRVMKSGDQNKSEKIHRNSPAYNSSAKSRSRYIPKQDAIKTRNRANYQCEFTNPKSNERCQSKTALQVDHVQPFAKKGASSEENIQLLCSAHNTFKAIKEFGAEKMALYLN